MRYADEFALSNFSHEILIILLSLKKDTLLLLTLNLGVNLYALINAGIQALKQNKRFFKNIKIHCGVES